MRSKNGALGAKEIKLSANERQVAGSHYGGGTHQHWDMVVDHQLNYFEGQITKYVMRCRKKNGVQDLEKAKHFIEKYIEEYDRVVGAVEKLMSTPVHVAGVGSPGEPRTTENDSDDHLFLEGTLGTGQKFYKCKHCGGHVKGVANIQEAHATHGDCAGRGYIAQGK